MRSNIRRITREQMIKASAQKTERIPRDLLEQTVHNKIEEMEISEQKSLKTDDEIIKGEVLENIDPVVISYFSDFTENKYYERHASLLIEKFKNFGIRHIVENIPSKGNYMSNCLMKPQFIHKKLLELKTPLIWMDCDTELRRPFSVFNGAYEDLGMATHSGDINGIKASPLFFNYTKGAFLILKEWILHANLAQRKSIKELDHDAIKHWVIPSLGNKITLKIISENYQDYCNGKYINNGNSNVPGKSDTHRSTMGLGDFNRSQITSNALDLELLIKTGNPKEDLDLLEKLIEKSANYCRLFFVVPELESEDLLKKAEIITGGRVSKEFEKQNSIKFELDRNSDIKTNWDLAILEKIEARKNKEELIKLIIND